MKGFGCRIAMIGVRGLASAPPSRFRRADQQLVGGAEVAAEGLSRALAARGHAVTLFTRGGEPSQTPEGVQLVPAPYVPGRQLEALSHSLLATWRAVRGCFDLVHFHAVGPGSCAAVTHWAGVPSVVTVQGLDWEREKWNGWERRAIRRIAALGLTRANAVVLVAPSMVDAMRPWGIRRTAVIPNGFSPAPEGTGELLRPWNLTPQRYLLMLTRLVPEKNIHRVISAFRAASPGWPLVIAGGAAHTSEYAVRLRREAAGDPRIVFLGRVDGVHKGTLLRSAGAYINASTLEGLSLAVLEALGAGVPVGLSRIPGNLDVFALTGRAPPADLVTFDPLAEGEIALALRRLVNQGDATRPAWRQFGAVIEATFSWSRIAERTEDLYWEVLK